MALRPSSVLGASGKKVVVRTCHHQNCTIEIRIKKKKDRRVFFSTYFAVNNDREDVSSMVRAGATANTTEGNSRASSESRLLCSHSHGEPIDTDQKKKRMGALGMVLRPSSVPGASGKKVVVRT